MDNAFVSAKEQYMALRAARANLRAPVLDQVAFYAKGAVGVEQAKASLELFDAEWTEDIVIGQASVWGGVWAASKARLLFNYDLGMEVEILTYLEGPHWHQNSKELQTSVSFLSHIGFHVNAGELPDLPFRVAQELITISHTNPAIAGRRYHYRIYDTRHFNGVFTKYIKRLS